MDKFRECMFIGCVWIGGGSGRSLEEVLAWVGGDGEDGWKYFNNIPTISKKDTAGRHPCAPSRGGG